MSKKAVTEKGKQMVETIEYRRGIQSCHQITKNSVLTSHLDRDDYPPFFSVLMGTDIIHRLFFNAFFFSTQSLCQERKEKVTLGPREANCCVIRGKLRLLKKKSNHVIRLFETQGRYEFSILISCNLRKLCCFTGGMIHFPIFTAK